MFQIAYSNNCRGNLPKNSVNRGYIKQKIYKDNNGYEIRRDKPIVVDIFIEPRFIDKYDAYKKPIKTYDLKNVFQQIKDMQTIFKNGYFKGKKTFTEVISDLKNNTIKRSLTLQFMRFLQLATCNSATTYQIRENFWRAAHKQPSIQSAKIFIQNASKESAPLTTIIAEKITDEERAFNLDKIFRQCANPLRYGYSEELKKYCQCFARGASEIMTNKEIAFFSKPTISFRREVLDKLSGKPANHRFWKLNSMNNNCIK